MKGHKGEILAPLDPEAYTQALAEVDKILALTSSMRRYDGTPKEDPRALDTFKCIEEPYTFHAMGLRLEAGAGAGPVYRIDVSIHDTRKISYKARLSPQNIQGRFKAYPHPGTPEFEDPEAWGLVWDRKDRLNIKVPEVAPEGTAFALVPEIYVKCGAGLTRCAEALFPSIQADWFFKGG